jgi:lactoylglutathione lyase
MKIDHIAIWVRDLEKSREFYEKYFEATTDSKYHNEARNFQSYFLSFHGDCRLELMHKHGLIEDSVSNGSQKPVFFHFTMSVGSSDRVNYLTNRMQGDGYKVISGPRMTGDGYYESVVLDPDENAIEITI